MSAGCSHAATWGEQMAATSRERRFRRKRALIVVLGVVLIAAAFAAFILLRHGVDGVVHFFTTPTMEAVLGSVQAEANRPCGG